MFLWRFVWLAGVCLLVGVRTVDKQFYSMNVKNMNEHYHMEAVIALLKVKSNKILKKLPMIEKVVFNECQKEVKQVNELAKCVVTLFNARDRYRPYKMRTFSFKRSQLFRIKKYKIVRILFTKKIFRKYRIKLYIKRIKKSANLYTKNINIDPHYLNKLKRMDSYYKMLGEIETYKKHLKEENRQKSPISITESRRIRTQKADSLSPVMDVLETVLNQRKSYSFLSPKLFSLSHSEKDDDSVSLFSFHKEDGLTSLPFILKSILKNDLEANKWLHFLMEVSGAAKSVDSAMNLIGNKMQKMEKQIYPSFKKLVSMERDHEKVDNEYDSRQKREIDEDGFTILSGKQLKLIYGDEPIINKLSKMSPEEMDQQIENDIKAIANYDTKRHRRSIKDPILNLLFNNSHFTTLKPFAFRNRFNTTIFISVVTLSPQAFVQETIVPQGGVTAILSPRAFHGFIASPNFAMTRILSPVFARYDILSPRALIYKLMSPEVLVLELLTPKALSLRIMSPDFLLLQILSPSALSPRVHSSDNHALVVLSPSIANPSYQSEDKFRVKILSPSFF